MLAVLFLTGVLASALGFNDATDVGCAVVLLLFIAALLWQVVT